MAGDKRPAPIVVWNASFDLEYASNVTKSDFYNTYAGKVKGNIEEVFKIVKAQAKARKGELKKPKKAKKAK